MEKEKRYYIDINEDLTLISLIDRDHNWSCINTTINSKEISKSQQSFENFDFEKEIKIIAKEEKINYDDIDITYVADFY